MSNIVRRMQRAVKRRMQHTKLGHNLGSRLGLFLPKLSKKNPPRGSRRTLKNNWRSNHGHRDGA